MSSNGKVVGYLGQVRNKQGDLRDKIILEVPIQPTFSGSPVKKSITIAHDYVQFSGSMNIEQLRDEHGNYPVPHTYGATNWIHATGDLTIGIRDMYDVILPMLNNHKHLQADHFKMREAGTPNAYLPMLMKAVYCSIMMRQVNNLW